LFVNPFFFSSKLYDKIKFKGIRTFGSHEMFFNLHHTFIMLFRFYFSLKFAYDRIIFEWVKLIDRLKQFKFHFFHFQKPPRSNKKENHKKLWIHRGLGSFVTYQHVLSLINLKICYFINFIQSGIFHSREVFRVSVTNLNLYDGNGDSLMTKQIDHLTEKLEYHINLNLKLYDSILESSHRHQLWFFPIHQLL
jgi:hypothetical protein